MKTQRNLLRNSSIVLLIFLMSACATPQAVIRMSPVSQEVKWNYGQAFAGDTVNGVIVEAAFNRATKEYNIFDVTVINASNMEYLVDPAQFYFDDITFDTTHTNKINAIDPEEMLLTIDKQIAQDEAKSKNAAVGFAVAAGVLSTAAVITAATDNDPHSHHHRTVNNDLLIAAPLVVDAGNDNNQQYLSGKEQMKDMWANYTIRKTTLSPGYKIDGKLYFPRFAQPGFYILKVPVDDKTIEIKFNQLNF